MKSKYIEHDNVEGLWSKTLNPITSLSLNSLVRKYFTKRRLTKKALFP